MKKFIDEQYKSIGEMVKEIAKTFPDIGHAIKCMNSEWYAMTKKDPSLRGQNLLEPKRIRAMCGDIISALKWLHGKLEEASNPSDEEIDLLEDEGLARLANIVAYHCGLHKKVSRRRLWLCQAQGRTSRLD